MLLSADAHAALSASRGGWQAKALGEFRFKGIGSPQHVFQLLLDGLPADFPPLRIDRMPPPTPVGAFGRSVRGYELREQVGSGDVGVVYRAYQPSVGREVAIKVIRPELVNQPSFVRGFESEARLVAQLEHPHLVSAVRLLARPGGRLPRDALAARRLAAAGARARSVEPRAGGPAAVADRRRAGVRPPAGRRPPRRQAGQRPARRGRQRVPLRLRDRRPSRRLGEPGPPDHGVAGVRPARGGRRKAAHTAVGPLRPRTADVRAAHRSAAADGRGAPVASHASGPSCPPRSTRSSLARPRRIPTSATRRSTLSSPRSTAAVGQAAQAAETYTPAENPYKGLRAFDETDAADFYGRAALVDELVQAVGDRPPGRRGGPVRHRKVLGRQGRARPGAPRRRAAGSGTLARHRHVPGHVPLRGARRRAPPGRSRAAGRPRRGARAGRARDPPRREADPPARQRAAPRGRPVRGAVHADGGRGDAPSFPHGPHRTRR